MHRFVWDLRYKRPRALKYNYSIAGIWKEGTPLNPIGPIVLPGTYNVILNADGKEFTQQLSVKMDPRIDVNPEQLKQQLALAKTVISVLEQSVDIYNQIDVKLKDSINVANKEISDSLKSLISIVDAISNVFAGLVTSVQSADTDPSQGQFELFNEYRKKFEKVLKKWKSIQTKLELNY
jgi:Fe2+ transport system protein B